LVFIITSIRARKIIRKFVDNNSAIYKTFDFSTFVRRPEF